MNRQMMTQSKSRPLAPTIPLPWLTVETALWGVLLLAALGLRLFRLGATPLNTDEARGALAAWRFAQGQGLPASADYSPLLFSTQWLVFSIFGGSDLAARLLPALAGTALVLAPALLRRQIGRIGALLAGALLALSPTAQSLSRTATGDVLAVLGTLLCVGGFWRYVASQRVSESASQRTRNTQYIALGLAVTLVSSPLAYSALISLVVALALLVLGDPAVYVSVRKAWDDFCATPNVARYALGTLAGSFVLLSTAFAWHIGGLAGAANLLPRWLDGFVRWSDSLSFSYPLRILFVYEPLVLFLSIAGGVLAMIRGEGRGGCGRFLVLWSVAAMALALIRPGHGPGDVMLVLVPLACLGGLALDGLVKELRRWGQWINEGAYLAISAPLWAFMAINLSKYTRPAGQYEQMNLPFVDISLPSHLSAAVVAVVILLTMGAILSLVQGAGPTWRGMALSVTLALLVYTVATAWGVSQSRAGDPRELLVLKPTASEARLLQSSLERVSNEYRGDAHAIDVTVLTDDPALAWVLRDFREIQFSDAPEAAALSSAVIAPQGLASSGLRQNYVGQSFPLRKSWRSSDLSCQWKPTILEVREVQQLEGREVEQLDFREVQQLDCGALIEWLIYRHSPNRPTEERVVLWLRKDLGD